MHSPENMQTYLDRVARAGRAVGFQVETFGRSESFPLLGMTRRSSNQNANEHQLYFSAGIHGDEPAGPQALLELLEENALPRRHSYAICPLLNPTGMIRGTRENAAGIDLNRDYRHFVSEETSAHAAWLERKVRRITHALLLHEDWESQGFYLYELNLSNGAGLSEQILQAVRPQLPIEPAEIIDGRIARQGVIRPESLPELEEGDPEAIYLYKHYGGLSYTLETPSAQDFTKRVNALKAAVLACV